VAGSHSLFGATPIYRDGCRSHLPDAFFIHQQVQRDLIASRLAHAAEINFCRPALLDASFATLEPLGADENGNEPVECHGIKSNCLFAKVLPQDGRCGCRIKSPPLFSFSKPVRVSTRIDNPQN